MDSVERIEEITSLRNASLEKDGDSLLDREKDQLINTTKKRKKNWIDDILKIPGVMREGKSSRDRKKMGMLYDLKDKRPYVKMKYRPEY